jgi:hypothetical protein
VGTGGRNDPNNVYTFEYMNKEKKRFKEPNINTKAGKYYKFRSCKD